MKSLVGPSCCNYYHRSCCWLFHVTAVMSQSQCVQPTIFLVVTLCLRMTVTHANRYVHTKKEFVTLRCQNCGRSWRKNPRHVYAACKMLCSSLKNAGSLWMQHAISFVPASKTCHYPYNLLCSSLQFFDGAKAKPLKLSHEQRRHQHC
jgi:hypothetical protein